MLRRLFARVKNTIKYIWANRFDRSLMRYFDWPLFIVVMLISLFGVVCIFSATSSEVTETPSTIMQMLETQSLEYAGSQLMWIGIGIVAMFVIIYIPYEVYKRYADLLYWGDVGLLILTLLIAQVGRGGMTAFLSWGNNRGFQTSEFSKTIMIICFAKTFAKRNDPIRKFRDCLPYLAYLAIPMILILMQPDFGTALVYFAVFCVLIFASGTDWRFICAVLGTVLLLALPVWYYVQNASSDSFRLERILMWLHPEDYPDSARQIINGQIAIGSGGLFGKGIVSPGSFASLGYISDDHTDFIFAIVCESFGLVGGCVLVLAYAVLLWRLIYLALHVKDTYGSYVITGVMGMLLFHIVENICMVIGLLPVTGIPLPFVSYGGSNMLTNMMCIGLAENVIIRSRKREALIKMSTVNTN